MAQGLERDAYCMPFQKGRNRKSGSHMIKCFVTEFQ